MQGARDQQQRQEQPQGVPAINPRSRALAESSDLPQDFLTRQVSLPTARRYTADTCACALPCTLPYATCNSLACHAGGMSPVPTAILSCGPPGLVPCTPLQAYLAALTHEKRALYRSLLEESTCTFQPHILNKSRSDR